MLNRLRRHHPARTDIPEHLLQERDLIRSVLGDKWWEALGFAAGNWLFDFLALLAALAATGTRPPHVSLVLLAYVVAALLGMVPLTPGGLGFVEVGLTATLGLAGIATRDATVGDPRLQARRLLAADPVRVVGLWGVQAPLRPLHQGTAVVAGERRLVWPPPAVLRRRAAGE